MQNCEIRKKEKKITRSLQQENKSKMDKLNIEFKLKRGTYLGTYTHSNNNKNKKKTFKNAY